MLYSSFQGRVVDLPLDAAGYEKQLQGLIAGSRFQKVTADAVPADVRYLFRLLKRRRSCCYDHSAKPAGRSRPSGWAPGTSAINGGRG